MTLAGALVMPCVALALALPLRRTTLWPLALPVALAFGEAAFIQTWNLEVNIPGFPVPLSWVDIVFGGLVVAWLLVRRLSPVGLKLRTSMGVDVGVLVAWLVTVGIAVPLAWIDGGALKPGIVWVALPYAYIPLSAFLLFDIFRRAERDSMWTLLRTLSVVVSVFSVLYVLFTPARS